MVPVLMGIPRCAAEPVPEALKAPWAALGRGLEAMGHVRVPGIMVIDILDKGDSVGLGPAAAFVAADEIFFGRIDVGVAVEDDGLEAFPEHALEDRAGARGAAGVEKDFRLTFEDLLMEPCV